MRVVSIRNYMGGSSRHDVLHDWVRRVKLWRLLHEASHFPIDQEETWTSATVRVLATNPPYNLHNTHEDLLQTLAFKVALRGFVDDEQQVGYFSDYAESDLHVGYVERVLLRLYDHILFLAAYHAVVEALAYVIVSPIQVVIGLRDKIKALNLPKNLFPQSLRPIKAAAL
jgi:hypothetical protein